MTVCQKGKENRYEGATWLYHRSLADLLTRARDLSIYTQVTFAIALHKRVYIINILRGYQPKSHVRKETFLPLRDVPLLNNRFILDCQDVV